MPKANYDTVSSKKMIALDDFEIPQYLKQSSSKVSKA